MLREAWVGARATKVTTEPLVLGNHCEPEDGGTPESLGRCLR